MASLTNLVLGKPMSRDNTHDIFSLDPEDQTASLYDSEPDSLSERLNPVLTQNTAAPSLKLRLEVLNLDEENSQRHGTNENTRLYAAPKVFGFASLGAGPGTIVDESTDFDSKRSISPELRGIFSPTPSNVRQSPIMPLPSPVSLTAELPYSEPIPSPEEVRATYERLASEDASEPLPMDDNRPIPPTVVPVLSNFRRQEISPPTEDVFSPFTTPSRKPEDVEKYKSADPDAALSSIAEEAALEKAAKKAEQRAQFKRIFIEKAQKEAERLGFDVNKFDNPMAYAKRAFDSFFKRLELIGFANWEKRMDTFITTAITKLKESAAS